MLRKQLAVSSAIQAIITVAKLLQEMQRVKARYGLATMCIGGGRDITTIRGRA